ncbi:hypothetical protein BGZ46_000169 [Entomortierella lignicola]|nr:hypothetical protein BGZ46_000169 [Entomortierella lignicola]
MHQENLLLDRNRNIIITDFGFANQFDSSSRDLMSTSCGSPCYAAPELVISDGLYVGSGVDIWSCGVILYAMLAGYLPFDDDPSNPDGDNINQLYNYILATTLAFPDHISPDARDLLKIMLVPDPAKRSNMKRIMAHQWLRPYSPMFQYTVEDWEVVISVILIQNKAQAMARLNGTIWIPPRQAIPTDIGRVPHYPYGSNALLTRPGPPRPSADEFMPRRHTIVVESVPNVAPAWEASCHSVIDDGDSLVPTTESSMDICEVDMNRDTGASQSSNFNNYGYSHDYDQSRDHNYNFNNAQHYISQQQENAAQSNPTEMMLIDPKPESDPMENAQEQSQILTQEQNTRHQGASLPEEVVMQNPPEVHNSHHGQLMPLAEPTLLETSPISPSAQVSTHLTQIRNDDRSGTPDGRSILVGSGLPNTPTRESSPTVSRRSGSQHNRVRPTTIHGEPMSHAQQALPTSYFGQPAIPPFYQTQLSLEDSPKSRSPSQFQQQLQQAPLRHLEQPHAFSQGYTLPLSSTVPQPEPKSGSHPHRHSIKTPPGSPTSLISPPRDSLETSQPFCFPSSVPEVHHVPFSQIQIQAQSQIQTQIHSPTLTPTSFSITNGHQAPHRTGGHVKTHRKGQSSSGRILNFLGGLSKRRGDSSNNRLPPTTAKSPQDSNLADIDSPRPLSPVLSALDTGVDSSTRFSALNAQEQHRLQQRAAQESYDTQKSNTSQRGKRRKTLSLVAGSGERPPHQQQQQLQKQSLHHPLIMRPQPLDAFGSTPINEQDTQVDRSSGTAQRIMGWLRRKSVVKSASERPNFDKLGELRATGLHPPFGQFNLANGSSHPNNRGSVVEMPNAISNKGDGTASVESNLESGSIRGVQYTPIANGVADGNHTAIVINNSKRGSTGIDNTLISPLRALEEGRDPSLAALIQALPLNWTDSKLKVHSGAVELSSLSSRHPAEIMFDIKKVVLRLGMEIKSDSDFKIKCVRRKRKTSGQTIPSSSAVSPSGVAGVNAAGGPTGGGTLSVKNLLQGHGLHRQPPTSGAIITPDDSASVMSSNISVDRETWIHKQFGASPGLNTPRTGANVPEPPSATGSISTTGKKRGGIRNLLWRNSTAVSLTSVQQPLPAAINNNNIQGGAAMSFSGSNSSYHTTTANPSRQLPQVMNGSALNHISSLNSGKLGVNDHGYVGASAGKEAKPTTDSAATEAAQEMEKGNSSNNSMMEGVIDQVPNNQRSLSQSTTSTTIDAAIKSHQSRLQRQETSGSSHAATTIQTTAPERFTLPTEPLYGEEAIDSGEEIRFSIELCRIKNLHGLYSVDIRRVRGNLWAYKFLYHAVLNTLDLQGKGGYLTGQSQQVQVQQISQGPASVLGTIAVSAQ